MFKISFILLFVFLTNHQVFSGVPLVPCKGVSTKGTAVEVLVSGDNVCKLKRGTNATIEVKFTTQEDIKDLKAVVHGIVHGVAVPFPIPNPDLCNNSGLKCPLKSTQTYTYNASVPVKTTYPAIKVAVRWENKDEHLNEVLCLYLDCEIV